MPTTFALTLEASSLLAETRDGGFVDGDVTGTFEGEWTEMIDSTIADAGTTQVDGETAGARSTDYEATAEWEYEEDGAMDVRDSQNQPLAWMDYHREDNGERRDATTSQVDYAGDDETGSYATEATAGWQW